jgi:hypothetical protein
MAIAIKSGWSRRRRIIERKVRATH